MEEILASIRKIIAEDSSGLRSPSPVARPGTPYTPAARPTPSTVPSAAPTPQRGFMSREAFLKSSQPVDPEPTQDTYDPLNSARPARSELASPAGASPARTRHDAGSFEREQRDTLRPRDEFKSKDAPPSKEPHHPAVSKDHAHPLRQETSGLRNAEGSPATNTQTEDASIETVEVVAVEDVLPAIKNATPAVLKPAPVAAATSPAASDAARIEAQLSELLSEDLSALRQSRTQPSETVIVPSQSKDEAQKAGAELQKTDAPSSESSDPFAFDLGPSPFAPKPETVAPAPIASAAPAPQPASAFQSSEPKIETPAPLAPSAPSSSSIPSVSTFEQSRSAARPSFGDSIYAAEARFGEKSGASRESNPLSNGFPFADLSGPFSSPTDQPAKPSPSVAAEPETPAHRSRTPFVVPSVSATLGPSRKLEPLSNAFQPAPPPPPRALETFAPLPENAPEPKPIAPPISSMFNPDPASRAEPASHTTLPATRSENPLDRPMEDAMADLLRPLLKTWLAENMPKIVERALRREMTERLLPGQKNSQE